MMIFEVKVPTPGESITEVEIGRWLVDDGSRVEKDQEIAEVESDKATLSLSAPSSGVIKILASEGERVAVGTVVCTIDSEAAVPAGTVEETETSVVAAEEPIAAEVKEIPPGSLLPEEGRAPEMKAEPHPSVKITSLAKKVMEEEGLSIEDVLNGLRRISKADVERVLEQRSQFASKNSDNNEAEVRKERAEERQTMTSLRRKLSQRLVAVKNETAMLTTFNEVDMSRIMQIREKYKQAFQDVHGLRLGFMAFFTKAVAEALQLFPMINSFIDGEEIITPNYSDVGIAVQTPKGLMVPIIRNAEQKSVAVLEKEIRDLAEKARNKKISIAELSGGTFTITNGGVFGSLLSTPILNPPQSAILGMHNIVDRPVAINGKVEIRPMMYLALSYDHRIIDGKDSVGFLVKVKQLIEAPEKLLFNGEDPEKILLGL
ncbi:MAG: 2-oxoglutarate dehydrogenase complex dihydrolipoyllysine-residue succinyltransferase [Bacteroidota bacterium]|nr:2-oxoglutarate dehydrogenase complex dihydrolipoyllysine-residue succinyltransferase [Bacteroidota bacterium]